MSSNVLLSGGVQSSSRDMLLIVSACILLIIALQSSVYLRKYIQRRFRKQHTNIEH